MSDYKTIEYVVVTNGIRVAKAKLWEEAKGKLRALYRVNGSIPSTFNFSPDWQEVKVAVEKFITEMEDEGLHE